MSSFITKKTIKHLSQLARIKLTEKEEEKFQKDLDKILTYFKELQEVSTEEVSPFLNANYLKNNFRKDEIINNFDKKGDEQFPDKENGFLKIPSVFEN